MHLKIRVHVFPFIWAFFSSVFIATASSFLSTSVVVFFVYFVVVVVSSYSSFFFLSQSRVSSAFPFVFS